MAKNFDLQVLPERTIKPDRNTEITVHGAEITSANIIRVEAGTNGYHGGDSGHGSRTYFSIENIASTDMSITFHANRLGGKVEQDQYGHIHGVDLECESVELTFGGDCELDTFIGALEFALENLKKQAGYDE